MDEVTIEVRDGGPYAVTGPVRIVDAGGHAVELGAGERVALCRCGRSGSPPFCDAGEERAGSLACGRLR